MELSFLRVAAIVPQVNVADCELNVKNIVACAHKACESGAKVLLYPWQHSRKGPWKQRF